MQAFFFIINLTLGKYDGTCFNYGAVSSDELCDYRAEQYMITRNDGKNIFRILFSLAISIICVCLLGNVLFGILTIAMFFVCVYYSAMTVPACMITKR